MLFSTATTFLAFLGTVSASPLMARDAPSDYFSGPGAIFPGDSSGDFESCLTEAGTLTVNDNNCGTFTGVRNGNAVTLSTAAGNCATDSTTLVFSCGAGITLTTYQIATESVEGGLEYYLTDDDQGDYAIVGGGGSPSGNDTVSLQITTVNNGESEVYQFTWQNI